MKTIYWSAFTDEERTAKIDEVEEIIIRYGFIIAFQRFSDMALSLNIETEEIKVDDLYTALSRSVNMMEWDKLNSDSKNECMIYMNITFSKGSGKLRIEVPAVPG